jgi:TRAP-type mannitol/chloroaromatic compound transport system substrate-binding protein
MDRRGFLKTTGAAAVAAGTATGARAEQAQAAPAILSGAKPLSIASTWGGDLPGGGAERLAWRIETATGGRYRIEMAAGAGDADLTYGGTTAALHPAFAVFSGLPFGQGLAAAAHNTWLTAGGGQMLWDELAGEFGFKPLLAGRTGPSGGVWASRRLEGAADLAGLAIHVGGLAAEVVLALGATPLAMPPLQLGAALADGRIQAAEWLGPLAAAAPDLQPLAERLYLPGFTPEGLVLALNVRRSLWEAMDAADRAIFEACAAQEYQVSLADAHAHALMAAQIESPAKWPVRHALPVQLGHALEAAADDVVARMAGTDEAARRIHDSYAAFRRMLASASSASA